MANINLFTQPGTFRRIKPEFIIRWLTPWQSYLATRGFIVPPEGPEPIIDYETLAAVFMDPDGALPRPLSQSVALIHEMATEAGMNAIIEGASQRAILLQVGDDPDPADVAVQLWLADPSALEELHQLYQLDRPRGFVHFVSDREPVPPFSGASPERLAQLEAALAEEYFKAKRGRVARVWAYPREDEVWFLVRHGLASRRQEVVTNSGAETLIFRPGQYDVLVYNLPRGELRIHGSSINEVNMLRRAFGKYLFDDEEFFPGDSKFTLAPLVTLGRAALACGDIPGMETVTLTELQMFSGGRDWPKVTYQGPDLFNRIESGKLVLPEPTYLVRASFQVRFTDSKKRRTVRIAGSNKLSVVRDGDTALIEQWLQIRGFMRPSNDAENDQGFLASA